MIRSNICEDRVGFPTQLTILLVDSTSHLPLKNAAVDIWHCDADGQYSGFAKLADMEPPPFGFKGSHSVEFGHPFHHQKDHASEHSGDDLQRNRPPAFSHTWPHGKRPPFAGHLMPTSKSTFLRGTQISDEHGVVRFTTIYPGWYSGRCLHMHLKVHTGGEVIFAHKPLTGLNSPFKPTIISAYAGGHVSHTGQLFFPEHASALVALTAPYANSTSPRMLQADDMIYDSQSGKSVMVSLSTAGKDQRAHGYEAVVKLFVDPESTPSPV